MSGGQFGVPLVIRMATGAGRQLAAQHSHSLEGWYAHVPGLRVVAPATLEDARGMLWTALEDPDPVVIFEHAGLYNHKGELDEDAGPVDLDRARVVREGTDVSLITFGGCSVQDDRCRRGARGSGHRGGGRRSAHAAAPRSRDDLRIRSQDASRRRRRRGLAHGKPRRRDLGAHPRELSVRSRGTRRARLHRGGADPVREAPRGGGAAADAEDRRRGTRGARAMRSSRQDHESGRAVTVAPTTRPPAEVAR
jgi:hypothetical protein